VHARLSAVLCALSMTALTAAAQAPATQAPQVTVGGVAYLQYLYQLKDTANHNNNFDVTRAYINVIGRFSGGLYTRITVDVNRPPAVTTDNSLRYRLKYAYAAYTPQGSSLTYKLGQIHTPFIDWEEALWDYRMQGQMAMERGGYLSSSDFGLGVDGNWSADKVNMQVGIYNGESYSGGTGDKRKDLMGRVSVRVKPTDDASRVGGLRVTAYGQYGKPTSGGKRSRLLGVVSYRTKQITLAGEYAVTKDSTTGPVPAPVAEASGSVASVFGVYHFSNSKAAVLARVDLTDPNTDVGNNRLTRFIGGASYQLTPNLRLLADLDLLSYQGGAPTPALEATRSQAYFQAQFTF
jgi:phosphate-selective porin O/P